LSVSVLSFILVSPPSSTEISTLSLHDALPIFLARRPGTPCISARRKNTSRLHGRWASMDLFTARRSRSLPCSTSSNSEQVLAARSEEHTSELQSRFDLVCRLLLEKNNNETRTT